MPPYLENLVYIYNIDINRCYECIGSLRRNFTNSYETMEEILEISTSHIEQLEYNIEQLGYRVDYLEHQMNGVKFLDTYQDWVTIFMDKMTDHLEKGDWKLVKKSLGRLSKKMTLTEQQNKCIEELKILLEGIGMSLYDVELLRKVKDQSNIKFHSNNQSLDQVKLLLHIPIPDEMNQYKPSLQKALEAIDKWNPSKI